MAHTLSFCIDSFIPIVLKNDSATSTLWSIAEWIVWSIVRSVSSIISITGISLEGFYLISDNSFVKRITFEGGNFLIYTVIVSNVKIDPNLLCKRYNFFSAFYNLDGPAAWWLLLKLNFAALIAICFWRNFLIILIDLKETIIKI